MAVYDPNEPDANDLDLNEPDANDLDPNRHDKPDIVPYVVSRSSVPVDDSGVIDGWALL